MRPGFVAFALAALIGASTASAECLKANQNGEVAADDIDKVWRADTIHVYSSNAMKTSRSLES